VNRPHDLGGVAGFGRVVPEPNEPVFHYPWEKRVFGMVVAVSFWRRWSLDASRLAREKAPDYLALTYYERWFEGLQAMLARTGLARDKATSPPLQSKDVNLTSPRTGPAKPAEIPTRYAVGAPVRTRVIDGPGHTRLPRYAQARTGVIAAHRGDHVLPDDSAAGLPRNIQPLYSVRFTARELFGPEAALADSVFLDLWEDYLDPA
jgi:nitrile hydratase beta subunit